MTKPGRGCGSTSSTPKVYRAQIEVAKAMGAASEEAGLDRTLVS
jgi:hypothetical protein